ncbi:MAG: ABC transporter ATP-binding protein [Chlamydiales bacterium]
MKKYRYHSQYEKEKVKYSALDWQLILRLLLYLRPYKWILCTGILFLLMAKVAEATIPILIGSISQTILDNANLLYGNQAMIQSLLWNGVGVLGVLLFSYFCESMNVIFKNYVGQKALLKIRTQVFAHIQALPISYFNQTSVGRLMTRTIQDVEQIHLMFSESIIPLIGSLFLILSACVGVVLIDLRLAMVFFLSLPLLFWATYHFRYYQKIAFEKIRRITSAMNTFFQEHIGGASTIRHFGLRKLELSKFDTINQDFCTAYKETTHHYALLFANLNMIQSYALIALFILLVLSPEGFSGGKFFTFSLYVMMIYRPIADLAERYNIIESAISAAKRMFDILDEPIEIFESPDKEVLENIETIEFRDVWFAYKTEEWVLKGVSFQVKKGETAAFVGMTGSGKTTIINLILRYHDPQKGSILINGKSIQDYSLSSLRKHMGIVLQDPVIFSGTIKSNITLNNKYINQQDIDKVVEETGLHFLIDRLPEGINQEVKERGVTLSAGEKQLISLARAVAHHRDVFLLDEATANIDTKTEKVIQKALNSLLGGKTAVVIAHRLSTIQHADIIFVIHLGVIREQGNHRQLLAQQGIYEKLYRLQFLNHETK